MPFTPELPPEIKRRMLTRFIALSKLTDLAEGNDAGTFLGVQADEFSSTQQKLGEFIDGYFLDAAGDVLDERCADLPEGFEPRRNARAARGGGVTLTRSTATQEEVYQPGAIIVGRSKVSGVQYFNKYVVTFGIGIFTVTNITVQCTSTGSVGNGPKDGIDTIVSASGTIYEVSSELSLSGGYDREEDADLIVRAKLWVNSLTRTTPDAIVAQLMNFTSSDGESLGYTPPIVWEDPDNRGYCEIIVDNGFGFTGYTRAANDFVGEFPDIPGSPRYQIPHDYPAATAPILTTDGVDYPPPNPDYLSIEERGVMYIRSSPQYVNVSAGTSYKTGGHLVLQGWPAEAQAFVEANCRAAGNRYRIVLPTPQEVFLTANVTVTDGAILETVFDRVKRGIVGYTARLPPGQPIRLFRLGGDLISIPGLLDIRFDQPPIIYAATPRTKLVVYYSAITLR